MDSNNTRGPQNLMNLIEHLRCYNPQNCSNITNPIENPRVSNCEFLAVPQEGDLRVEHEGNPIAKKPENIKSGRAAVLICLFEGEEGEIRVILTKRSATLSSHSGEVSLPGGKVEEGDANDVETALREAKEEMGLEPSLVNVVTVLEPFTNRRGISIIPVIGIIEDKDAFRLVANAAEVEAIFDAPLEMFLKDKNRREVEREYMGQKYLLHFFDHKADNKEFVIWAITAGILIRAASMVYQRPPDFQERRPPYWNKSGL